jgi:DNA polymerase-3 subunit delta
VLSLASQAGLTFSKDAWVLFTAQCNDLLSAKQTILRLSYLPQKNIDAQILQDYLPETIPCEVFDLADAALEGNASKVVQLFYQLNAQSDINILILWSLTRDIETLIALKSNQNPYLLPKRKSLFMKAFQRFADHELASLLKQCARLDIALKGGKEGLLASDKLVDLCVMVAKN